MKKFLKVLLYLIGFPALLGLVIWKSLTVWEQGSTYSFWPYVGTILAGVFFIIFTIVFIVTGHNSKKNAGNRKKVTRSVATLVIFAFVLTSGLWLVIDIPEILPAILDDATSGTVTFDKLREDYDDHAVTHGNLLNKFIEWNIANRNLDPDLEDYWYEQGYNAPEVQELIAKNFQSIDVNGYKTFKGPWLNIANDGRMTIQTLVHLIINERDYDDEVMFHLEADVIPNPLRTDAKPDQYLKPVDRDEDEVEVNFRWSILDMAGGTMDVDLGGLLGNGTIGGLLTNDAIISMLEPLVADVLTTVDEAIADPALADNEIYICLDMRDGNFKLALTSAVQQRGMWDYQSAAWLNSNNLLFAVISIFPARQVLYIWGGMVIFSAVAVGAIRLSEYGGKKREEDDDRPRGKRKKAEAPRRPEPSDAEVAAERDALRQMTPYDRAFYTANKKRSRV